MKKGGAKKLLGAIKTARRQISELSPSQRSSLVKSWDVEHAYYSSTLEGSRLDKKEFEKLAKKAK